MRVITRGLGLRYPAQDEWALDAIDLDIAPGEVTWLDGALGSGTSTLLLALGGLAPRLTGGDRRGLVPSRRPTIPTSGAPLASGIAYLGPSPGRADQRCCDDCPRRNRPRPDESWLDARTSRSPRRMTCCMPSIRTSGRARARRAVRRRNAAGVPRRAAGFGAPVWLLDEPFSALDHAATDDVQRLLRDWAAAGGTVIVACDDADAMLPMRRSTDRAACRTGSARWIAAGAPRGRCDPRRRRRYHRFR